MEEDIESSSGSTMVPIALALLAIVLGGAGLYFGMTANQQLAPLTESIDEGSTVAAETEKQIASLEKRISELSIQNEQLKGSLQRLGRESSQTLRIANKAESGVSANREEMVKLAEAMQQLANAGGARSRPASATSESSASSETVSSTETSTAPAGAGSTYSIQSGDTFAKIASKMGISLDALLDANPDADPRRLRIGQEIQIPAN